MNFQSIVFWQPMVSFHQSSFITAVAANFPGTVSLVTPVLDIVERRQMGWVAPHFDNVALKVAPTPKQVREILDQPGSLHVHSGLKELGFSVRLHPLMRALGSRVLVISEAADYSNDFVKWAKALVYRATTVLPYCLDGVLTHGKNGHAWFRAIGIKPRNIFPHAYFMTVPEIAPELSVRKDKYQFLYVGRLSWEKAPDLVIAAFGMLQGQDAELTLIGGGPLVAQIQAQIDETQSKSRITRFDYLPHDQVLRHMRSADCLLVPSRYDGWAVVVQEALSQGCRVVVGPRVGAGDLILGPETGERLQDTQPETLAAAMFRSVGTGRKTVANIESRRKVALTTSSEAGAAYFFDILRHVYGEGPLPRPPWAEDEQVPA